MDKLREAIKLATKIHQESRIDEHGFYSKTILQAADEAVEAMELDKRSIFPIYALLFHCWNETLEWANNN